MSKNQPSKGAAFQLLGLVTAEMTETAITNDPKRVSLSEGRQRSWSAAALTISRLAPITDTPDPKDKNGKPLPDGFAPVLNDLYEQLQLLAQVCRDARIRIAARAVAGALGRTDGGGGSGDGPGCRDHLGVHGA